MNFKSCIAAAAALLCVSQASAADLGSMKAPPPEPAPLPYFLFADTQIAYFYETRAREPGSTQTTRKHVISLSHFDVTKWGTNLVVIDFKKSDNRDPANGVGSDGALEVYGVYRGTISGNWMAGGKAFGGGFIKDVSLAYGFDANTKNTTFAPQKRLVLAGAQVAFDVPGYLTLAAYAGKEWNHCGVCPVGGINPEFKTNAHIEVGYMQPLAFTGMPLRFSGFTNFVTPKGKDGFGDQTKLEILSDNRLTLDVGKLANGKANVVDVFLGYRYWKNKFGSNYKITPGSIEQQLYVGLAVHAF